MRLSVSKEAALPHWEELCISVDKESPYFASLLRKKKNYYLNFLDYPKKFQKTFSTSNLVEAVNGQLERLRRNSGGYFASENSLFLKIQINASSIEAGAWIRPSNNMLN
ncbi:MAG: transposase [Deltaproteobacteria bacterium]|nr:transposase [Deltaproteobacteria bacterium]